MKETNVWLSPEELQHMLRGSLQWNDVESRGSKYKTTMRKLGESSFEKQPAPIQAEQPTYQPPRENAKPSIRLEGQPVIWLLGSVGLLTLSTWFYYVLHAK